MSSFTNDFAQPIGAPVPGWTPRPQPTGVTLAGRYCQLEPLQADRHAADLDAAWEVLAEPIQTVMRRYALPNPYERLKELTRGKAITRESIQDFIRGLELPEAEKQRLLAMTPGSYTGVAESLAKRI